MNELAERAYAFTQEMPQDTISAIHIFRETQEIGAYVKYSYEALRAIEEIAVRRCLGVSTALREGVITIQIQEQDLRIWIMLDTWTDCMSTRIFSEEGLLPHW